ncbi:MAG: spondin domain-containing protein [Pirellulales bacterium]
MRFVHCVAVLAFVGGLLPAVSLADTVQVQVTVENLAPTNSIAFAPLRIGFGNGSFDSFDTGQVATAPIISIAEGGSGSDWFPAFEAAEPDATLGTVVPNPAGPLLPGASASAEFTVDTAVNRFFTFASMVVPSNDYFIGNDSPMAYELFDAMGNLKISTITQFGSDIWDAGSETTDAANAAFLVGGTNALRTPQNGVVNFDFADLSTFNGLMTAAGYTFDSQLAADTAVYRISFAVVPEPSSLVLALGAVVGVGLACARRRVNTVAR